MGKIFCSLWIAAGLSGMPLSTQALQIVHWGEGAPSTDVFWRPPQASSGLAGRITVAASQHDSGIRPAAVPAPEPLAQAHPMVATWTVPSAQTSVSAGANDFEGGPRSGLLAGLGAVAVLMWRRLRRG